MQGSRPVAVRRQAFFGPNSTTRSCGRKRVSDATRTICSHFAPITSRNRTKQEQARCIIRKRGTTDCRTLFPKDQRVTGHGRVVLITQRSSVQIRPPQPKKNKGLAGAISLAPSSFSVFFPVGRLAQRSSSALPCSFRVRSDCSPRQALASLRDRDVEPVPRQNRVRARRAHVRARLRDSTTLETG